MQPKSLRRWLGLLIIAVAVTGAEVTSALLTLLLLRVVTEADKADNLSVPFVHRLVPGASGAQTVYLLCAAAALFFVVRAALYTAQSYAQHKVAAGAGAALSVRLVEGYLAMPYAFHLTRNTAELMRNAYASVAEVVLYVFLPMVSVVAEMLVILSVLVILTANAPLATLLCLVVLVPLVLFLLRMVQPRAAALGERHQQLQGENIQALQQAFHGLRDARILGREAFLLSEYERSRSALAHVQYRRGVLVDIPRPAVETALLLFIVTFMALSVARGQSGGQGLALLGLFAYAALRVLPSLNRVLAAISNFRFGAAALHIVHDELMLTRDRVLMADRREPIGFTRDVVLDRVSYTYDQERGVPVIRDVSLRIVKGEWIGIVGASGAGKTTLVNLMLGLLEPSGGELLVDGVPVRGREIAWFPSLGLVSQNVYLSDDTLLRNIAFGLPDELIEPERVASCLEIAQLSVFVHSLPEGIATRVGEMGSQISGGERQRIAIARALYRSPELVVFDEGTSALDNLTEAAFVRALQVLRRKHTLITVAHRLSTVRECDRLILLERGSVAASGTYTELLGASPLFREMAGATEERPA